MIGRYAARRDETRSDETRSSVRRAIVQHQTRRHRVHRSMKHQTSSAETRRANCARDLAPSVARGERDGRRARAHGRRGPDEHGERSCCRITHALRHTRTQISDRSPRRHPLPPTCLPDRLRHAFSSFGASSTCENWMSQLFVVLRSVWSVGCTPRGGSPCAGRRNTALAEAHEVEVDEAHEEVTQARQRVSKERGGEWGALSAALGASRRQIREGRVLGSRCLGEETEG